KAATLAGCAIAAVLLCRPWLADAADRARESQFPGPPWDPRARCFGGNRRLSTSRVSGRRHCSFTVSQIGACRPIRPLSDLVSRRMEPRDSVHRYYEELEWWSRWLHGRTPGATD